MNIKQALESLDPSNDEHWTADGLPLMDVMSELVGGHGNLTRAQVTDASPDFTRQSAAEKIVADGAAELENADGEAPNAEEGEAEASKEASQTEEVADHEELVETVEQSGKSTEEAPSVVEQPTPAEANGLDAQLAEATEKMIQAQKTAATAKEEANAAADEVNAINRRMDALVKSDPNHATAGIRAYINQQNKNRLNRAAGLTRFIEATGVDPAHVAKAIDPRAPIDRAMHTRKPGRGTTRPGYPRVAS